MRLTREDHRRLRAADGYTPRADGDRAVAGLELFEAAAAAPAHRMHQNSLEAYRETRDVRAERSRAVLAVYRTAAKPITDREALALLFPGRDDPNLVRPAITHLVHAGALREVDRIADAATKRKVRRCAVA